jgi:hypothetical protein
VLLESGKWAVNVQPKSLDEDYNMQVNGTRGENFMFSVLVDTCVWLDIAKDPRQAPVLGVVEEMIKKQLVTLIVPHIVLDEFRRNRDRIAADSSRSLATHFRLVKDAVDKVGSGDKRRTQAVLTVLDDVSHKIPIIGGSAGQSLDRIEGLLTQTPHVEASDGAKVRAAQRALDRRAPFHRDRNSMADALLIETYGECAATKGAPGTRFAFVTHNKNDFSLPNGNQKLPHPDIAAFFSRVKSLYFINLVELLRRIDPSLVSDVMFDLSWSQEPRGLSEILKAEDVLFHQVWYNRHWNLRIRIEQGRVKLVEKETYPRPVGARQTVQRDIWKGALKAARRTEQKYGKKNLGPWDDFQWGMINGKLSALRWVLGDDWDMLDT